MPQVRCINLLDFLVRKDNNELIQPVSLMFEKEPVREATNVFRIYHIQMPIFKKKYKTLEDVKGNLFYTWLYMLDNGYKDEGEMNMLASMTEGMKNFAQKYNIAINDPRLVKLYQMEQDAIRDEKSRLSFARNEGLRESTLNAAIGMKAEGIAVDMIARITGLSVNEVMAL